MTRWRLVGLVGCVAAIVVVAARWRCRRRRRPRGHDRRRLVVRRPGARHRPGTGLLDALAPVLSPSARRPPPPAPGRPAAPSCPPRRRGGRAAVPRRLRRADGATARSCAAWPLHEWGGVVLRARPTATRPSRSPTLVGAVGVGPRRARTTPRRWSSPPSRAATATPSRSARRCSPRSPTRPAAQRTALATARALHAARRTDGARARRRHRRRRRAVGGPRVLRRPRASSRRLVAAAVTGYKTGGVAPVPGHFPGEGAASGDPVAGHRDRRPLAGRAASAATCSRSPGLAAHAPAIQLSAATYVAFDGVTPATLLPDVVTALRDDLGFRGVIVSGDLAAASLATGRLGRRRWPSTR